MKTYTTGVTAVHLGGSRIRFTCPLGHETVRDYSQGPAEERLNEIGALRLALMWDDRIRLPFTCRKCP
jgi:hypothetical protein